MTPLNRSPVGWQLPPARRIGTPPPDDHGGHLVGGFDGGDDRLEVGEVVDVSF
jgi:hypothetical protein